MRLKEGVFLNHHASLTVILTVQSGHNSAGVFLSSTNQLTIGGRGRDGSKQTAGSLKFSDALQKMTRRKAPRDGGYKHR
ncbi:unnamed protein product [Boreogadus saida]